MQTPVAKGVRGSFCHFLTGLRGLPLLCALFVGSAAAAEAYSPRGGVTVDGSGTGPLGASAGYLVERGSPLDLAGARRALARGSFRAQSRTAAGFGIAAPPVWMRLELINPGAQPLRYCLLLGKPWLDRLDVYQLHGGRLQNHWHSGDGRPGASFLVPALGYALPVTLMPGRTELFVRAYSPETLILPVSLLPPSDFAATEQVYRYRYGAFYGFLLAFALYSLMLYAGLRERAHLYYALYLCGFLALSVIYTGHGFFWWWPQQTGLQRDGLFAAMALYACAGFLFAARFLRLQEQAPRLRRWIGGLSALVIAAAAVLIAAGWQLATIYLAYATFAVFTLGMPLLGLFAWGRDRVSARLFLPAILCSMAGLSLGLLSAFGVVTASVWTIGAVELGLVLEAALLSFALGSRMRRQRRDREEAEQLARTDSLTGLSNRRAFVADAAAVLGTALRHRRPISAILLDIDCFKQINDRFGHERGDRILERVAQLLSRCCREGDILARWGGEEFVLLLPETDLVQAIAFGERIRREIEKNRLAAAFRGGALTVSLGVAQLESETTLGELVAAADRRLYEAKRRGRNRVVPPLPERVVA